MTATIAIGDRTPGFTPNEYNSVTVCLQHESPDPEKETNWLLHRIDRFALALRICWTKTDILNGKREPAAITKA